MQSLGSNYRALVIGASGAIGQAFTETLKSDSNCTHVSTLSRRSHPGFALEDESSMAQAAQSLASEGPYDLIIDATGALTIDGHGPEKHLGALDSKKLVRGFEVNAIGPVLLLKHFSPLLGKDRSIYAKLSARVGSITDNKKGGWYGYRAAKAALNMLLQTAAIEIQRKRPQALVVALQPGTVQSPLSAPFSGGHDTITASESAAGLLLTLDSLDVVSGAQFFDFRGSAVPW
jgi:NAD(P)-dependent dehydrogenase (short-subunit alcohol dehydrogenase family)